MRVLQVIDTLVLAGAEILVTDLAINLRTLGIDVDVMCLSSARFRLEEGLTEKGIAVIHAAHGSPYSLFQVFEIRKQILHRRYDLIHSHLFPAQLWTCIAAGLSGLNVPLVTTEHSTWNRRRRRILRPLDRWMYSKYSAIACISFSAKSALRDWLGDESSRLLLVNNGIDLDRFCRSSVDANLGKAPRATTLACVANLRDGKGHDTLLHAIGRIPNVELLLVGDGPKRLFLENLAAELGAAKRIHFLGHRSDVAEILAVADIYVQPSYWEGFGIAAVEAMAMGLPVVASDVPGLREVVAEAGLLFAPGSVPELEAAIARLVSDSELRDRLGSRGRLKSQGFSIKTTAAAYLRIYEDVIAAAVKA